MKKQCKKCNEIKETSEFNKNKAISDGLQGYCRECDRESSKLTYQKNIEKNRMKRQQWQEENRELHNEHCRNYFARIKEKSNESKKNT